MMKQQENGMTQKERDDIARVIRDRAKVAKAIVEQRKLELRADVEAQLSAKYKFDDEQWADVTRQADAAVQQAQQVIAEKCREKGIPEEFAPRIELRWYGRGENALAERRGEVRKTLYAKIDALGQAALVTIQKQEVELQTELIAGSLTSSAAKKHLQSLPAVEQLMPPLVVETLQLPPKESNHRALSFGDDFD
jgi:hypothetical protein